MSARNIQELIGLMQKNLECSICLELLTNPVSTKCDHYFCSFCITEFLQNKRSVPCPLCKQPVTKRSLQEREELSNIVTAVRQLISAYQDDSGTTYSPPKGPQSFFPCTPDTVIQPEPAKSKVKKNLRAAKQAHKPVTEDPLGAFADEDHGRTRSEKNKPAPPIQVTRRRSLPKAESNLRPSSSLPSHSLNRAKAAVIAAAEVNEALLHYLDEGSCGYIGEDEAHPNSRHQQKQTPVAHADHESPAEQNRLIESETDVVEKVTVFDENEARQLAENTYNQAHRKSKNSSDVERENQRNAQNVEQTEKENLISTGRSRPLRQKRGGPLTGGPTKSGLAEGSQNSSDSISSTQQFLQPQPIVTRTYGRRTSHHNAASLKVKSWIASLPPDPQQQAQAEEGAEVEANQQTVASRGDRPAESVSEHRDVEEQNVREIQSKSPSKQLDVNGTKASNIQEQSARESRSKSHAKQSVESSEGGSKGKAQGQDGEQTDDRSRTKQAVENIHMDNKAQEQNGNSPVIDLQDIEVNEEKMVTPPIRKRRIFKRREPLEEQDQSTKQGAEPADPYLFVVGHTPVAKSKRRGRTRSKEKGKGVQKPPPKLDLGGKKSVRFSDVVSHAAEKPNECTLDPFSPTVPSALLSGGHSGAKGVNTSAQKHKKDTEQSKPADLVVSLFDASSTETETSHEMAAAECDDLFEDTDVHKKTTRGRKKKLSTKKTVEKSSSKKTVEKPADIECSQNEREKKTKDLAAWIDQAEDHDLLFSTQDAHASIESAETGEEKSIVEQMSEVIDVGDDGSDGYCDDDDDDICLIRRSDADHIGAEIATEQAPDAANSQQVNEKPDVQDQPEKSTAVLEKMNTTPALASVPNFKTPSPVSHSVKPKSKTPDIQVVAETQLSNQESPTASNIVLPSPAVASKFPCFSTPKVPTARQTRSYLSHKQSAPDADDSLHGEGDGGKDGSKNAQSSTISLQKDQTTVHASTVIKSVEAQESHLQSNHMNKLSSDKEENRELQCKQSDTEEGSEPCGKLSSAQHPPELVPEPHGKQFSAQHPPELAPEPHGKQSSAQHPPELAPEPHGKLSSAQHPPELAPEGASSGKCGTEDIAPTEGSSGTSASCIPDTISPSSGVVPGKSRRQQRLLSRRKQNHAFSVRDNFPQNTEQNQETASPETKNKMTEEDLASKDRQISDKQKLFEVSQKEEEEDVILIQLGAEDECKADEDVPAIEEVAEPSVDVVGPTLEEGEEEEDLCSNSSGTVDLNITPALSQFEPANLSLQPEEIQQCLSSPNTPSRSDILTASAKGIPAGKDHRLGTLQHSAAQLERETEDKRGTAKSESYDKKIKKLDSPKKDWKKQDRRTTSPEEGSETLPDENVAGDLEFLEVPDTVVTVPASIDTESPASSLNSRRGKRQRKITPEQQGESEMVSPRGSSLGKQNGEKQKHFGLSVPTAPSTQLSGGLMPSTQLSGRRSGAKETDESQGTSRSSSSSSVQSQSLLHPVSSRPENTAAVPKKPKKQQKDGIGSRQRAEQDSSVRETCGAGQEMGHRKENAVETEEENAITIIPGTTDEMMEETVEPESLSLFAEFEEAGGFIREEEEDAECVQDMPKTLVADTQYQKADNVCSQTGSPSGLVIADSLSGRSVASGHEAAEPEQQQSSQRCPEAGFDEGMAIPDTVKQSLKEHLESGRKDGTEMADEKQKISGSKHLAVLEPSPALSYTENHHHENVIPASAPTSKNIVAEPSSESSSVQSPLSVKIRKRKSEEQHVNDGHTAKVQKSENQHLDDDNAAELQESTERGSGGHTGKLTRSAAQMRSGSVEFSCADDTHQTQKIPVNTHQIEKSPRLHPPETPQGDSAVSPASTSSGKAVCSAPPPPITSLVLDSNDQDDVRIVRRTKRKCFSLDGSPLKSRTPKRLRSRLQNKSINDESGADIGETEKDKGKDVPEAGQKDVIAHATDKASSAGLEGIHAERNSNRKSMSQTESSTHETERQRQGKTTVEIDRHTVTDKDKKRSDSDAEIQTERTPVRKAKKAMRGLASRLAHEMLLSSQLISDDESNKHGSKHSISHPAKTDDVIDVDAPSSNRKNLDVECTDHISISSGENRTGAADNVTPEISNHESASPCRSCIMATAISVTEAVPECQTKQTPTPQEKSLEIIHTSQNGETEDATIPPADFDLGFDVDLPEEVPEGEKMEDENDAVTQETKTVEKGENRFQFEGQGEDGALQSESKDQGNSSMKKGSAMKQLSPSSPHPQANSPEENETNLAEADVEEIAAGDVSNDAGTSKLKKSKRRMIDSDTESSQHSGNESEASFQLNFTSSSAMSSQSEVMTTQQRTTMEAELERLRAEIAEMEAKLHEHSSKSDSGGDSSNTDKKSSSRHKARKTPAKNAASRKHKNDADDSKMDREEIMDDGDSKTLHHEERMDDDGDDKQSEHEDDDNRETVPPDDDNEMDSSPAPAVSRKPRRVILSSDSESEGEDGGEQKLQGDERKESEIAVDGDDDDNICVSVPARQAERHSSPICTPTKEKDGGVVSDDDSNDLFLSPLSPTPPPAPKHTLARRDNVLDPLAFGIDLDAIYIGPSSSVPKVRQSLDFEVKESRSNERNCENTSLSPSKKSSKEAASASTKVDNNLTSVVKAPSKTTGDAASSQMRKYDDLRDSQESASTGLSGMKKVPESQFSDDSNDSPRKRKYKRIKKPRTQESSTPGSVCVLESGGSPTRSAEKSGNDVEVTDGESDDEEVPRWKRKKLGFIASGLDQERSMQLRELAGANDCKVYSKFNDQVTHVIIRTDPGSHVCDRTLKYFQGVAGRCWVLSFDWVVDSLDIGHPVPEARYEVRGDTVKGDNHKGPKLARLASKPLLAGFAVSCVGVSPDMSKKEVTQLLRECGAEAVEDPWDLSSHQAKHKLVIRCVDSDAQPPTPAEIELFNGQYKHLKLVTVAREWLLDSICTYTLQPLADYVFNTNKDLRLPL